MKLTERQEAVLQHLAASAVKQKQWARKNKRRFPGGWIALYGPDGLVGKHVQLRTVDSLVRHGLAELDPPGVQDWLDEWNQRIRISRCGVEHLEKLMGEVIYA